MLQTGVGFLDRTNTKVLKDKLRNLMGRLSGEYLTRGHQIEACEALSQKSGFVQPVTTVISITEKDFLSIFRGPGGKSNPG